MTENGTHETYMQIRERNIAANRNLLLSLQLSGPGLAPKLIPKPAVSDANIVNENASRSPHKTRKIRKKSTLPTAVSEPSQVNADGRRRSGRILNMITNQNQSQKEESSEDEEEYEARDSDCSDDSDAQEDEVGCQGKKRKSAWHPPREPKRARGQQPPKRKAKSLKGSRPDPKIFGHQIGTEVGDWWDSRMMCSQAGVHAPPVSGIAGNDGVGCYSVALSGGYEDDVDLGYAFTFTGAGGRALSGTPNNPKNLRTAPQSFDQEFTSVNASLKLSCEKKNPVRVIRGYKNHSPFAPDEGYRYDGLYKVEKCWREPGQSGFQVCKFAFVRLPDQPRIPVKKGREAEAEQMYQDMGFKLEDLPPLPEERQPWTQSLAKQRQQAKRETLLKTESELSQKNKEDSTDFSEQRRDKETCDVDMETQNSNTHSKEDAHDSAKISNEEENVKMEEARDINLNTDVFDSVNTSKQPEAQEEACKTKRKAVDDQLKENADGSIKVSSEQENAENKNTEDINLNKEVLDSVDVSKQSETEKDESKTKKPAVEHDLKADQPDATNALKQVPEDQNGGPTDVDLKVDADDHAVVDQQQSNDIHQEAVAVILKPSENGRVEDSSSSAAPDNENAVNSKPSETLMH